MLLSEASCLRIRHPAPVLTDGKCNTHRCRQEAAAEKENKTASEQRLGKNYAVAVVVFEKCWMSHSNVTIDT